MVNKKDKLKLALISGAAYALKLKRENPSFSEEEVIRSLDKESEKILSNLGRED